MGDGSAQFGGHGVATVTPPKKEDDDDDENESGDTTGD